MQGMRYATKMMNMVFKQDTMLNKSVYGVTKLPSFYLPSYSRIAIECDKVKNASMTQRILKFPTNDSFVFLNKSNSSRKKGLWCSCYLI